jgi:hypothetical protein
MPHQYDLIRLIKAGGYLGTSGQNFRTHVPGANATGANARDYIMSLSSWGGSIPDPGIDYGTSPLTFNMLMYLARGSRAGNIQRMGNVVQAVDAGSPSGFTVSVSSNVTGGGPNAVDVTLTAPWNGDDTAGAIGVFDDPGTYTDPGYLHLDGYVSTGGGGMMQCYFQVQYLPDNGPFNPLLTQVFPVRMLSITRTVAGIDWEWHNNSAYTSFYSDSYTIGVSSAPQDTFTKYLRWRRRGDVAWNNFGVVSAHDNRF